MGKKQEKRKSGVYPFAHAAKDRTFDHLFWEGEGRRGTPGGAARRAMRTAVRGRPLSTPAIKECVSDAKRGRTGKRRVVVTA